MFSKINLAHCIFALTFAFATGSARADAFCCECRDGKKHDLDESNMVVAGSKCTAKCKRLTVPKKGACQAPAPETSAATPAAPSASAGGAVATAYKSDDCSGDGIKIEKSEAQLSTGVQSYQVERGVVRAFEKSNFAGASTSPVLGSMCVSPGWSIGSIKLGQ